LTALTTPSWVKNCVRRSETSRSGRFSSVTVVVDSPRGELPGSVLERQVQRRIGLRAAVTSSSRPTDWCRGARAESAVPRTRG
jgi:hypothetical protein